MATLNYEKGVLVALGGEKIPLKNMQISTSFPPGVTSLKFTGEQTISSSIVLRGVQCGKTNSLVLFWKWFINEHVYQRPYRHMWE